MNDKILNTLYIEYKETREKLYSIETSIKLFGGAIPHMSNDLTPDNIAIDLAKRAYDSNYPLKGTWRDKIKAILLSGEKLSASEIADRIILKQKELQKSETLHSVIAQYCSIMRKDSLAYERFGKKYIYYIPSL